MVIIQVMSSIQQQFRNILRQAAAYDTVENRTFLPIQDMNREFMMTLNQKKLKLENEDAATRRKPDST